MERYLKEEPKLRSLQKLQSDQDTAWDIFTTPNWSDESPGRNASAQSAACPLSCSVVVKKEPLDEYEDDVDLSYYEVSLLHSAMYQSADTRIKCEPSDCSIDRVEIKGEVKLNGHRDIGHKQLLKARPAAEKNKANLKGANKVRSIDRLPLLTPPSSPESIRSILSAEAELALLGHQGLVRVSTANGTIQRLRLPTTNVKNPAASSDTALILNVNQRLPTTTATIPSTSK